MPGFRNDTTVPRTKDLLQKLGDVLGNHGDGVESAAGEACGGATKMSEETQKTMSEVKSMLDMLQNALVTIRGKILKLYLVENHVRFAISSEASQGGGKKEKRMKLSGKKQKDIKLKPVENDLSPSLAQLATQQDRLYQSLVELKAVHDVIELVVERCSMNQFDAAYPLLRRLLVDITPFLEKASPVKYHQGAAEEDDLQVGDWIAAYAMPSPTNTTSDHSLPKSQLKNIKATLLYKVGQRGAALGNFDFPVDAAFMPDGSFMVCDKNNQRLQMFDNKGNFKKVLLQDEVKPRRVCFNPRDGYMYVSDELAECVKIYTPQGQLVRRIGETMFQCPAGMDIDTKGNLVMTDAERCFVSLHQPTGDVIAKFYYRFLTDKLIPNPYYATVNDDDQLIVSDFRNNIVKVFSNSGQVLFKIEKLKCPRGVCVDPYGNILIAEGDGHCVSMYNPYGKFVCHLVTAKDGLQFPLSIDMNMEGQLIVTQCGYYSPHEVLVFKVY